MCFTHSLFLSPSTAASCQRVRVETEVEAYPTESVDLRCQFVDGGNTKLTQVARSHLMREPAAHVSLGAEKDKHCPPKFPQRENSTVKMLSRVFFLNVATLLNTFLH